MSSSDTSTPFTEGALARLAKRFGAAMGAGALQAARSVAPSLR